MTQPRHRFGEETGDPPCGAHTANGHAGPAPASRQVVADHLKCLFAELTSGPMPEHLLALVDQLEASGDEEAPGIDADDATSAPRPPVQRP